MIMKTRLTVALLSVLFFCSVNAQDVSSVYDYFNNGIDELVSASKEISDDVQEEKSNFVFSRLFSIPAYYSSLVGNAGDEPDSECENDDELLAMDEKRTDVIDGMVLSLYATEPGLVQVTESELREEKRIAEYKPEMKLPELSVRSNEIPQGVAGGLKTNVSKPNFWKFSGRSSLTFTQNFISENWYQGGESNYSMLATIDLDINYDDKDRISWTNHFDLDLGFATSQADTLHSFRTNTDKIRIESTFGYKLVKNLDLAAKLKVESQMLPNYPINTRDFISNCLAPLDANASIGFNYKPNFGNFKLEIYLAPLSAFNFRYVHYERLANDLGVNADNGFDLGRGRARQDFGTQLVVTVPTYQLTSFLDVYSRLEYYTDYHRSFFQWETKFNAALSKYFTASLMLNARFDDSVAMHKDWKLWQFKELFTLGVAYSW